MKIFERLSRIAMACLLSLTSLLVMAPELVHALGNCTWNESTSLQMSNGSNWSNCNGSGTAPNKLPAATDDVFFDTAAITNNDHLINSNLHANNFTFQGAQNISYAIDQATLTIDGDVTVSTPQVVDITSNINFTKANTTISVAGGATLIIDGVVGGSINLTKTGDGTLIITGANTYNGTMTASGGTVEADDTASFGSSSNAVSINNGADLQIGSCSGSFTFANPLTLTGQSSSPSGNSPLAKLAVGKQCSGSGSTANEFYGQETASSQQFTLSGAVTLGSDVTFAGHASQTTLSGALSGSHSITTPPYWSGKLVIASSSNTSNTANGSYTPGTLTVTLSDSQPSSTVEIGNNTEVSIDGTRSNTTVDSGGMLKGTGTVGALSVAGTVAPGHSPGCITASSLTLTGTYQAEIGGTTACSGYDQLQVTGAVSVAGATLSTSLYGGFVPSVGQQFTIIDNRSSGQVAGTFSGLAAGASFTANGVTYSIAYNGGDGNDVVLTVQAVDTAVAAAASSAVTPGAPDTGFALSSTKTLPTVLMTVFAPLCILMLAARSGRFSKTARK